MDKVLVVGESGVVTRQISQAEMGRVRLPQADPVRHAPDERPAPQSVRGRCPECGDDLVSNLYYIAGEGYLIRWECWSSLSEEPACRYQKVL
jgi:hypothetical protein